MKTPTRTCGYIRLSSKEQVGGESLTTQHKSITQFAKQAGYKLTEIYSDEGISGGSVEARLTLIDLKS